MRSAGRAIYSRYGTQGVDTSQPSARHRPRRAAETSGAGPVQGGGDTDRVQAGRETHLAAAAACLRVRLGAVGAGRVTLALWWTQGGGGGQSAHTVSHSSAITAGGRTHEHKETLSPVRHTITLR